MEIKGAETTVNKVEQKKEPKVKTRGTVRALGAAQLGTLASLPAGIGAVAGMQKIAKSLSPEQIKVLNETADRIIKETKLADKGVKIANVTCGGINFTPLPDLLYEQLNPYAAVANGKNAAFLNKDAKNLLGAEILHPKNTIIINREKLPTAVFHEIGHAFNYNNSKFWKAMQSIRTPAMAVAASLALFGAVTKKAEAKDGKELTTGQKAKNFVRKNAGILATLSMLPVVAEETMASIRAAKWANKNLTKDLAKKVKCSNLFGAISYTAAALGLGLAAHLAVKVKDNVMEKQKAKALKEAEAQTVKQENNK